MPEAIATPSRSSSTSASSSPESAQASIAATIANCDDRSRRRALTRSRTSAGSTAIRPAILTGRSSAQGSSRWRTPDWPLTRASQVDETSPPTGEVVPSPVTTTRLFGMGSSRVLDGWMVGPVGRPSALGVLDEGDGVADGLEVLHLVVGDRDAELLLGGHDDLDHGQRVDVEVVDEGLVELDVLDGDTRDLVDDLGEVGADLFGGGHAVVPLLCCHHRWCRLWSAPCPRGTRTRV